MDQNEIKAFFDRLAPNWDRDQDLTDEAADRILDAAGIAEGAVVLDVGCGTGVLFPYYVNRNAEKVYAVDLSPGMIRAAREKKPDPRIELICADALTLPVIALCDAAVLFNCFPHFPDPDRLFCALCKWLKPGGRLTVAHNLGLRRLNAHHFAEAESVSRCRLSEEEILRQMEPYLCVDRICSEEDMFYMSGTRRAEA